MAETRIRIGATDNVSQVLRKIELEMTGFKRKMDGFSAGLRGALSVGAGVGFAASLVQLGKASIDAQIELERLEKSYQSIFGQSAAGSQLERILGLSNDLGLSFVAAAEGAKSFFAAGQGTTLAPEMERIFKAVSTAGAALQLSADDIHATFIALGQVISKGKVQAEELRGQLGERLPGAFQMAAKAMGMTTAELDKFMADGKLTAEELLPRLATVLEETYAKAAENAADSIQGSINRMNNAWTIFKANLLDSEPIVASFNAITKALDAVNAASAQADARQKAIEALKAEGVKPAALLDVDPSMAWMNTGANLVNGGFSEAQIQAEMDFQKMKAEAEAYWEQWDKSQAAALEKATGDMRQAIDASLKDTYAYEARALEEERTETLKKIRAGIDAAVREGSKAEVIAGLEADFKAVEQVYKTKLQELRKKHEPKPATGAKAAAAAERRAQGNVFAESDWGAGSSAAFGAVGSAIDDVKRRDAELKRQLEENPFRAMLHYSQEWADSTKSMGHEVGQALTGVFDSASDSFANFVMTGKLNFADFTNSIIADMARMAARQAIGGIVGGIAGGIGSFFGFGGGGGLDAISGGTSFWAQGGVLQGGDLSAFSNAVVSRPTVFSYDRALPRFAAGAGLMGEAGPEAIMPLTRMANGRLGVQARNDSSGPPIVINIHNATGQPVTQQQSALPGGGKRLDVYIGDMAAKQAMTPGSNLSRAMSAQTGLQAPAIRR